jgi:hypothetical protein
MIIAGVVTSGGMVAALVLLEPPAAESPPLSGPEATVAASPTMSAAPVRAVRMVHHTLHALNQTCQPHTKHRLRRATREGRTILRFAKRYPAARFPIHDETGTAVELLMVTREALRTCAPTLVPTINTELPRRFQDPGLRRPAPRLPDVEQVRVSTFGDLVRSSN